MQIKTLLIDNLEYPYYIKESRRARYIRLQIKEKKKVELIVPYRCSHKEAEKFLLSKTGWIQKHINLSEKVRYNFYGNEITVLHKHDFFHKNHLFEYERGLLTITSPMESRITTEKLFNEWLKLKAKEILPERVKELSEKFGFTVNKISVRGQSTRWGSCSRAGNISLNYKLISLKNELIDYVIIHELCHLIEMNHSPRFWKLVEKYIPSYKILRKELKGNI